MLLRQWLVVEVAFHAAAVQLRARLTDDRGQATAEYALVVLGAATVAMMLIAWATSTGRISSLLNKVVSSIADRVS